MCKLNYFSARQCELNYFSARQVTFPHCLACKYEKMLDFEKCEKSLPDTQKLF